MKRVFDNKIFKTVTGVVRTFLIILMVFYVGFVILQRLSGNNSIMGYRFFTVATGSMKGVYDVNDVIAVQDCEVKNLKVGDDIAYMGSRSGLEGKIIVHRIIRIDDAADGSHILTTKGVNSAVEDPTINDSQVLGCVQGKIPVITQINHIVRSQVGFFALIFIPLVLVIVLEILQTITDYQLDKNEIQRIENNK
ncbi:MAG: signal peptidase I [Bacilli bacterium]|nr:signal peptidase I [Bacilli bacterium]